MAPARPCPRSPLARLHATAAVTVERGGWRVPFMYSTLEREMAALHHGVGLLDASSFAKMSLRGSNLDALAAALANGPALQQPGRAVQLDAPSYTSACRVTDKELFLCSANIEGGRLQDVVAGLSPSNQVVQQDETSCYSSIAMLGPKLEPMLQRLAAVDTSPSAFAAGSCMQTTIAGVHARVIRPPALAVPAVLVYVSWDLGEYLWQRLTQVGQAAGVEPVGFEAWESLFPS